ncbi:MAG: hypothetical protein K6E29_06030 [Cyanobacteria bacterium RUI128]|nr:hypothetical protein [Cyanobacteria bacterium RUI128]
MNLGINNTAFKGNISFIDDEKNYQNINAKNIQKIYTNKNGNLCIDTSCDRGFDTPDVPGRPSKPRVVNESYEIPSENTQKDYDRFLKVYDIASRNNVTISYLNAKSRLDEQLDF